MTEKRGTKRRKTGGRRCEPKRGRDDLDGRRQDNRRAQITNGEYIRQMKPVSSHNNHPFSDLKLIDELLCDLRSAASRVRGRPITWKEVEQHSTATKFAMARLREAWSNGMMESITLSISNYFEEK